MVDELSRSGAVTDPAVEAALRAVPRHLFVPEVSLEQAYGDHPVVTKTDSVGVPISSASQPAIVALMLEQLQPRPGQRVLEIGAGTGYNAALLSHIVGEDGRVITVDIDPDVVLAAWESLDRAGISNVDVLRGDGGLGWVEHAPYDRIIVTVGAWDLPPAWFDQLDDAGRLVVPLGLRGPQRSLAFEKLAGRWRSRSAVDCGFMHMRGAFAGPGRVVPLGSGVTLTVDDDRTFDAEALAAALARHRVEISTGTTANGEELFTSHSLWLALTEPDSAWITVPDSTAEAGDLDPPIRIWGGDRTAMALHEADSLALPVRLGGGARDARDMSEEFELEMRGYGAAAERLALRLALSFDKWKRAGKPTTDRLRVEVYPVDTPDEALEGRHVIDKLHCRLAVDWS
jgi:protein-L-isoaspartate(D-aspartate) O-methyltransferase